MIVLRATAKLLDRLGVRPEPNPSASTGALGDWFATMLHARRVRYVLAISGSPARLRRPPWEVP